MGMGFMELLKRCTVFLLAGQIILRFLPAGSYEKYVKMLVGLMLLSQLASPILSLGGGGAGEKLARAVEEYERQMEVIAGQVEEQTFAGEGQAQGTAAYALTEAAGQALSQTAAEYGVRVAGASAGEEGTLVVEVCRRTEQEEGGEGIRILVDEVSVGEGKKRSAKAGQEQTEELRKAFAVRLGISPEKMEVVWSD